MLVVNGKGGLVVGTAGSNGGDLRLSTVLPIRIVGLHHILVMMIHTAIEISVMPTVDG